MGEDDRRARALKLIEGLRNAPRLELTPDRVRALGFMLVPPAIIEASDSFKLPSTSFTPRVQAAFLKSGFLAPIVLDQHLRVIDGALRLETAHKYGVARVSALVIEATPVQAAYLRFILNRSAEVQRWQWDDLDGWLNSNLESYLTTLEPLGIFGEQVIPDTYMGPAMVKYRIDAHRGESTSQEAYGQEPGMAEWATRKRVAASRGELPSVSTPTSFTAVDQQLHPSFPLDSLTPSPRYKRRLWERKKALKRSIGITGFVSPLLATPDGIVLDGALRLEVVRELHAEGWWPTPTVPVVTVAVEDPEASFLRIIMNRTSEVQRWDHAAVNSFIDSQPQLRPLYEAYGLYTDKVLAAAAWSTTALRFQRPAPGKGATYDPATTTLTEWGEQQRKRHLFEAAEKEATPLKSPGDHAPLFTAPWEESDLLPLHDVSTALDEHVAGFLEQVPAMHVKPTKRKPKEQRQG